MTKSILILAAAATVCMGQPALAQAPSRGDDLRKLESQLEELRSQVKEVEEKIQKAKEARTTDRRPGPPWGFGRMDPAKLKEMRERFEKLRKEGEKREAGKRDGRRSAWGAAGRGQPRGRGIGTPARRPVETRTRSDVEDRLDRIRREVEELRRSIRQQ